MSQTLKHLTLIHTMMIISMLLSIIVTYNLVQQKKIPLDATLSQNLQPVFSIFIPLLAILGYSVSMILFKKKITELKKTHLILYDKLKNYRALCILQYVLLEAPIILACIASLLTGSQKYLVIAAGLILALWFQKPSEEKIIYDLNSY